MTTTIEVPKVQRPVSKPRPCWCDYADNRRLLCPPCKAAWRAEMGYPAEGLIEVTK